MTLENTGFGLKKSKNTTLVHEVWCKTATISKQKCHKQTKPAFQRKKPLYVLPPGDDRLAWTRKNLLGVSFSSVSTNPSVASEKTYFTEMANGNRRIPLSPRLSWWIKLYRLRRHNIQRSFWLILPQKKKFTLPLPRQRTNWSKKPSGRSRPGTYPDRSCFFHVTKWQHYRDICSASGQACSWCHKTDHFAGVCQQVARQPSLQTCLP